MVGERRRFGPLIAQSGEGFRIVKSVPALLGVLKQCALELVLVLVDSPVMVHVLLVDVLGFPHLLEQALLCHGTALWLLSILGLFRVP